MKKSGDAATLHTCHTRGLVKGRPWSVVQEAESGCRVSPRASSERHGHYATNFSFCLESKTILTGEVNFWKSGWSSWCIFFPLCQIVHQHIKKTCDRFQPSMIPSVLSSHVVSADPVMKPSCCPLLCLSSLLFQDKV